MTQPAPDGLGFGGRIAQLAAEQPDAPALRFVALDGGEPVSTWRELHERSARLAVELAARGLGVGDRLGLGLRNSPEFVLAAFAAWKVGAVPVPVRWDLPDWELERLRTAVAAAVFLGPADLGWIRAAAEAAGPVPELADVVSPRMNGICSSGSTGTPKVIVTGRPALYDPMLGVTLADQWSPIPHPQTILVLAPMYHTNGFTTLYNMITGDRLVVMEKFDAARVVDVIERYGVTNFTATPTMLQRIADLPGVDGRDLSSIVWFTQGAAPMPPSLVHRWAGLVGPEKILMAYGMTEGIGLTAVRGDEWMAHPGTVGRGVRGTEVRILGDDGADLPAGEIGEIYLRTSTAMGYEYLGDAPRMKQTPDGFSTAGDMGFLDADGYLHLVDRRVDIVITGGANVFPAEVEAALIDHPDIADVVVVGLKDPEWGRRVHAIVEPADPDAPPAEGDVIRYAKSRLAAYKVPKSVEVVDAIPRSAATKVNRGALVAARGG